MSSYLYGEVHAYLRLTPWLNDVQVILVANKTKSFTQPLTSDSCEG